MQVGQSFLFVIDDVTGIAVFFCMHDMQVELLCSFHEGIKISAPQAQGSADFIVIAIIAGKGRYAAERVFFVYQGT